MTAKTRLVDAVKAVVDPVTGGMVFSSGGIVMGGFPATTDPLGLIGDSRTENGGYFSPNVISASVAGATLTANANYIGTQAAVGSTVIITHNPSVTVLATSYDFIVATVATVVDAHNITANITWPTTPNCLPSGALSTTNSKIMVDSNYPNYSASIQGWLLALRNKAYRQVYNAGFNGARVQDGISHQVPYLISKGCREFWIYLGINDLLETVDNRPASYLYEKYKELWMMLRGNKVIHFLEQPCSGAYATATNRQRVIDINAWIVANAPSYGVSVFDAWTPLNDTGNSGYAATGMLHDGLHPSQKGSQAVAMSAQGSLIFPAPGRYATSQSDVGQKIQPVANPTFLGTTGASQVATGYSGSATGLSLDSYGLTLLSDGVSKEQYVDLTASAAAQSYSFRNAAFTVIPGQKYRISMTMEIVDGVSIDYISLGLHQQSDNVKYGDIWMNANTGYADGSYIITASADYVCHASLTSAYLRALVAFSAAGSAQLKFRNWECRAI